jgi:hypothetical protein
VSVDPRIAKALCYALIGFGALTLMSAVVNGLAVAQLIEPSDEESLGISRGEMLSWSALLLGVGTTMILLGLRWRRQASSGRPRIA